MKVELEPDIMRKCLNELKENVGTFNSYINSINSAILGMSNVWGGNDYNNFNSKMGRFVKDLESLKQSIESHNELLEDYLNEHENLDNEYGSRNISLN